MPRLIYLLIPGLALTALSCGPADPNGSAVAGVAEEAPDLLDELERRVAEVSAGARESAVALEYTAADAPSGARRVATGVVVNEQGDVLSIRIDRPPAAAPVVARDASGRRLAVRWLAEDPETGLTLLRLVGPGPGHPTPRPAPRAPRLGSQVLVIGNPFGLGHSVSRGSVAGLDRRLELGPRQLGGLIQIDAPLHPGDSGALVVDLRGDWLGLVRSGLAAPGGSGGSSPDRSLGHDLGFAIPARDALWVADQLRTHRTVERAYLGVRIDLRGTGEPPGALLDSVLDAGPAARAGLKPGDRVIALDGQPIPTPRDLTDRLDRTLADSDAVVEFFRGPHRARLVVRPTRRPPVEPVPDRPAASRPPSPLDLADRIEKLERRLKELEKEPEKRQAVARP